MKLVIAIVSEENASGILDALTRNSYRATLISSTGGFLRKGNSTLLIGVRAPQVDAVLTLLADASAAQSSRFKANGLGGTIFVMDVEWSEQV